jgi:hypothetical protein
MTPGRLVVPVQPDGNYPDIEPVEKHSDVQRGIEPIYQSPKPQGDGRGGFIRAPSSGPRFGDLHRRHPQRGAPA